MDRLSAYAKWLIENEDKKGSPDFETVANAYRSLRGQPTDSLAEAQRVYDELHKPKEQPTAEPRPEKQSVLRQVADVPIGIARGAAQGIRMIADAFGPDNVVSQAYRGMEDMLGELYSAQAKNDQKKIAQIMKDAEDKGIGDQLVAAVQAFATAPVDMLSQALGTAAPIVAGGLLGSVARLGAAGVGAVQTGLGAAMGAGTVKGTIYEAVKGALTDAGEDPKVAERKAREAQSYTGENWGQVLAGTALGGLAGKFGVEDLLLKRFTQKAAQEGVGAVTPGILRRSLTAGATEAVPEMAQAGQEQLAENVALQRAGFDVPTFRGVAGQAALEGLAGAGLGAGLGALPGTTPRDQQVEEFRRALKDQEQETTTEETDEAQKKAKKLKLEDLDPAQVQTTLKDLERFTIDPEALKERGVKNEIKNSLRLLGLPETQVKGFLRAKNNQELVNALTKFLTPKPATEEKQGEQLDQVDQQTGGAGVDVSSQPGAATTTTGITSPSTGGVGSVADASQQVGMGAQQLDTSLTQGTPSVATSTQAQQAKETGTAAPAQGAAVAAQQAAKPPSSTINSEAEARAKKLLDDDEDFFIAQATRVGTTRKAVDRLSEMQGLLKENLTEETRQAVAERVNKISAEVQRGKAEVRQYLDDLLTEPSAGTDISSDLKKIVELYDEAREELNRNAKEENPQAATVGSSFDDLTRDEKQYYINQLENNTLDEATTALESLLEFSEQRNNYIKELGLKSSDTRLDTLTAYETNRKEESAYRGVSFPAWNELTPQERQTFAQIVPRIAGKRGPSGEAITFGFAAIEPTVAERQADIVRKEIAAKQAIEDKLKERVERERDVSGLKSPLPEDIKQDVIAGNSKKLITYLKESAKGPKKGSASVSLFRGAINKLIASVLEPLVSNVKIQYIPTDELAKNNRPVDFIASYNAKTNTVYVTDRGLNETALLHEFVHAATIQTIFKYLNNKKAELTAGQKQGVASIIKMYNYLKYKTPLGKKYPTAFSNIYEFVSYGLTDPRLENDLRRIKSPSLTLYTDFFQTEEDVEIAKGKGKKIPDEKINFGGNLFEGFAKAVADVIGLTHRYSKIILHTLTKSEIKDIVKNYSSSKQSNFVQKLEEGIIEAVPKSVAELVAYEDSTENTQQTEKEYKKLTKKIDESLRKLRASLSQGLEKGETASYENISTEEAQQKINEINKSVVTTDPAEKAKFIKEYKSRIENKYKTDKQAEDAYYRSGRITRKPFTKEQASEIKRLETVIQINSLEADKTRIAGDLGISSLFTEADFSKVTTTEQGYLGNLFIELMSAFEAIASPPEATPEFRIQNLGQRGGETKKTQGVPVTSEELLVTDAEAQKTIKETGNRLVSKMEAEKPTLATKTRALKDAFNKDGRTRIIEQAQNYRYRVDRINNILRRVGKLISFGKDQNNLGTALATSAGRAENAYQKHFYTDISKANDMLADLAKSMGITVQDALARLHMYAIHLHDPERRKIKYLREVPLADNQAVRDRDSIIKDVIKIDRNKLGDAAAKQEAQKLLAKLEALVAAKGVKTSPLFDMNNEAYNTLGPYSLNQIEAFGRAFSGDNKTKADKLIDVLQKIEQTTIDLNKKSNYFSPPVQNLVDFYDFKFYFPFKGRPDTGPADYQLDYFGQNVGGDLQDKQEAFDGRITDADNPILNVLNEASKSAMRLGRHEAGVTLSIKNLIDSKIINGKPVKTVSFEQRFDNRLNEELKRGVKNIFHYLPDGKIQIYEINDRQMLEAIKRPLRDDNWFVDSLGKATSMFGQMHTRFNPAFAPMDFLRNLFTYAGVLGAETSGKRGFQVMTEMASILAKNGFTKTAKYSLAFSRGNEAEMARLAKTDPFYKDLREYYELGGRVAYLQGITIKDNLTDAVNAADQNGVIKSLSGANKFFDAWLDMFEMSTRIAAYRTIRDQFVAEGMPIEQAKIEAVAYAKNLANFEKTGIKGKELGAFFMFFRPAATGAVRAYEALSPALDYFKSDEELKNIVKKEAEDVGKLTDADINKLVKKYRNRTKSAATVSATLFGVGAATFMMAAAMAGDDDEGRNKVLTDDPARWVRNARFNTGLQSGGKDIVLQIPWGFGPGAFASVGAQIAAFASGSQSFGQFINNVLDAGAESFMPIPISKINKFEHPVEAALDSVLPSALKPLFEWAMNMDGLGREIYNNRQSRNNDAYTGGDNIPEFFKDAARLLYNMSDGKIDVSPNTMYFFANNYLDGVSRLASWSYNTAHTIAGNRDFDFKTDTLLLDAYLKAPSNYDARQFSEVEKEIKNLERRYRAYTSSGDAERIADYFQEHPYDKSVIDYYNKFNGQLNKLRELANKTRTNTNLTIKERQDQVRVLIDNQNKLKSAFVQSVAAYGIEPD